MTTKIWKSIFILCTMCCIGFFYSCKQEKATSVKPEDTTFVEGPFDEQTIMAYMSGGEVDRDTGELISSNKAAKLLVDYKDFKDPKYSAKKDIYGFSFGINKVNEFMKKIDDHNKKFPYPHERSITGVRVYFGMRNIKREKLTDTLINDVFLVPVIKKGGKNFYPIDNDHDPNSKTFAAETKMILNSSLPCPNHCD
jgi:hypothetical protein